ncbi:PHD finger protein 14-like [Phytophthora palmivora]|uniref:PHD finger protein 14-like n=1 Tax=Phytophthora palmivora TaxID=4796 RepID=A0A2P4Y0V9_9STRA|nr:PHD finger protein 14-like [Phytophthora palmivora]
MTRTQVEIRLVPSKSTVRKAEHPPTYQQAQNMPSSTSLNSVGVESRAPFGGNKKRLSRSPSVREDDTSSHADSFEPDDTEEENVETSYIASELTANGGAHDDETGNESETGTAKICINELGNMDEIELEQMQEVSFNEYPSNPKAQIGTKLFKGERERQTRFYYDQHTYTVVSRLRAVNKRLSHQLEQQNKLVTTMIEEKKQYLQLIDSLRTEVQMHKQTLRPLRFDDHQYHRPA